ncbi:unnamed protein product [Leptidea sinapis]|uniref:Uncharacterized protein n=1 Tax=Leptidea sinapis TaxID=189913 RepID=A0A5E4QXT0_9NEOP|nr:unnamed protein product [Leptidea sinapis]
MCRRGCDVVCWLVQYVAKLATHPSHTSLAHIPRLLCMRKNLAPLSRFHQSCADRGEYGGAVGEVKRLLRSAFTSHCVTALAARRGGGGERSKGAGEAGGRGAKPWEPPKARQRTELPQLRINDASRTPESVRNATHLHKLNRSLSLATGNYRLDAVDVEISKLFQLVGSPTGGIIHKHRCSQRLRLPRRQLNRALLMAGAAEWWGEGGGQTG